MTTLQLTCAERGELLAALHGEAIALSVREEYKLDDGDTHAFVGDLKRRVKESEPEEKLEISQRELDECCQAVLTYYRRSDTRTTALLSLVESLWDGVQFGDEPIGDD